MKCYIFIGIMACLHNITAMDGEDPISMSNTHSSRNQAEVQQRNYRIKESNTQTSFTKPIIKHSVGYMSVKGIKVYYQTATRVDKNPPKVRFPILLLHGAAFSSQTWRNLGTLKFLAKQGYHPIAIDLPSFGKTRKSYYGNTNDFMDRLIATFGIAKPVLVSPSMSGRYSIPYVLNHYSKLRGYIPVAPAVSNSLKTRFKKVSLPALIVYGTRDFYGKSTSDTLSAIPGSIVKPIPDGSHPAYLDNPNLFHQSVKKFLQKIYNNEKYM